MSFYILTNKRMSEILEEINDNAPGCCIISLVVPFLIMVGLTTWVIIRITLHFT